MECNFKPTDKRHPMKKLVTQKESDRIFFEYAEPYINTKGNYFVDAINPLNFNKAINAMLYDEKIVKAVLKRIQKINSK